MVAKLFVLGLPGSGKSTIISHYIEARIRDKGFQPFHINDYLILNEMFHNDKEPKQFKAAEHGGFNVIDISAFDTALKTLEQQIDEHLASTNEIMLIEFSRNDYCRAFHQFELDFFQSAYFLHLDVDVETCKSRIRERVADPNSKDDYFVSDYIFDKYYNKDDGKSLPDILAKDFGIERNRVLLTSNVDSIQEVSSEINTLVDQIIIDEFTRINSTKTSMALVVPG